ncbi:hypothetical protein ACFQ3R_06130 [Mesonia ostreae]|uniref:Uncharacterized protein n=1 Tax=Mesonia ostreae TaxID=861110 RepID=A0ABU2KH96_9FLAO|nr:hypothetical protein [Mesonia ostreae]MDT0294082.1 hypothetical protein [Mesonia ostreae]
MIHNLVHSDNDASECVWCHLSASDKNTPILAAEDSFEINPVIVHEITKSIQLSYCSIASSKTPVCLIFNKPPPFFTV